MFLSSRKFFIFFLFFYLCSIFTFASFAQDNSSQSNAPSQEKETQHSHLPEQDLAPDQVNLDETNKQEEQADVENIYSSKGIEIYFLQNQTLISAQEIFKVSPEQEIMTCLKIKKDDERYKKLLPYLRSYQIVWQNNDANYTLATSLHLTKKKIHLDEKLSCYWQRLVIPQEAPKGSYQISRLDLYLDWGRVLSLQSSEETSKLARLELNSILSSAQSDPSLKPLAENLIAYSKEINHLQKHSSRIEATALFRLVASSPLYLLKPNQTKIYFKVFFDEDWVDTLQAKCKASSKNLYYDCKLNVSRAAFQLKTRKVSFILDSIHLENEAGDRLDLVDVEDLKKLYAGELFKFEFY